MNPMPALLSVLFSTRNDYQTTLCLRGHCESQQRITVIHDRREAGVCSYVMAGDDTLLSMSIAQGEAMTIIVRDDEAMLACGVYEVDLQIAEVLGAVLAPKAGTNLIVDQCDATVVVGDHQHSCDEPFAQSQEAVVAR